MDVNPIDLIIGSAVMPPIIAILNQRRWPAQVKALVALAACLIAALLVELIRGPLHAGSWRDTALVVAGSAFIAFKTYWQPSGIAPAIEAKTSAQPEPDLEPVRADRPVL